MNRYSIHPRIKKIEKFIDAWTHLLKKGDSLNISRGLKTPDVLSTNCDMPMTYECWSGRILPLI